MRVFLTWGWATEQVAEDAIVRLVVWGGLLHSALHLAATGQGVLGVAGRLLCRALHILSCGLGIAQEVAKEACVGCGVLHSLLDLPTAGQGVLHVASVRKGSLSVARNVL